MSSSLSTATAKRSRKVAVRFGCAFTVLLHRGREPTKQSALDNTSCSSQQRRTSGRKISEIRMNGVCNATVRRCQINNVYQLKRHFN
jgi:hypothetical protein